MNHQFHFWVYRPQTIESMVSDRYLCTHIQSSIIHNSQKVEETQVAISGWMDKQNVVYTYKGILFSLRKEGNSGMCSNMDEPWQYFANKWNKSETKGQTLYDSIYMRYLKQSNLQR